MDGYNSSDGDVWHVHLKIQQCKYITVWLVSEYVQQQVKMKDALQHQQHPGTLGGGLSSSGIYSDGDIGSSDSLSLAGLGQKSDMDRRTKKKWETVFVVMTKKVNTWMNYTAFGTVLYCIEKSYFQNFSDAATQKDVNVHKQWSTIHCLKLLVSLSNPYIDL